VVVYGEWHQEHVLEDVNKSAGLHFGLVGDFVATISPNLARKKLLGTTLILQRTWRVFLGFYDSYVFFPLWLLLFSFGLVKMRPCYNVLKKVSLTFTYQNDLPFDTSLL